MKPLYESILKSTGSGKTYFPLWSRTFQHDQWKTAGRLFCDFYDIKGKMLKEQIEQLFLSFVQKSNPIIESFRIVLDDDIEQKLLDNTKLTDKQLEEMVAFKVSLMNIFLIIESEGKFWIWQRNTQMFERIFYSDVSKYLARE